MELGPPCVLVFDLVCLVYVVPLFGLFGVLWLGGFECKGFERSTWILTLLLDFDWTLIESSSSRIGSILCVTSNTVEASLWYDHCFVATDRFWAGCTPFGTRKRKGCDVCYPRYHIDRAIFLCIFFTTIQFDNERATIISCGGLAYVDCLFDRMSLFSLSSNLILHSLRFMHYCLVHLFLDSPYAHIVITPLDAT